MSTRRVPFSIGELRIQSGKTGIGELPIARLVTGTQVALPLRVLHGIHDGPIVWLSAAVHGDEIAGVEIIRRATAALNPKNMRGTVLTVPIVNAHGFLTGDRYLPDRRDLNRSFPGSANGSLAGRVAHLFMSEIVARCDVGIDLHTGSDNRSNLPQIRADLDHAETRRLAEAFGAPLMLHAPLRDGSLRGAATAADSTVLLYEGGEANRFDSFAIKTGTAGVLRVLAKLGIADDIATPPEVPTVESRSSSWVRARKTGIMLMNAELGDRVERGQPIAIIRDAVGTRVGKIAAHRDGIIIGLRKHPLVNQGDAVAHIAETSPK